MQLGAEALSNAELVAILLSTGDYEHNVLQKARTLLREYGLVGLLRADVKHLMRISGLGDAKVTRVKAAVELAARGMADDEWDTREPFRAAEQVFRKFQPNLGNLTHEEVWVLVLDQQHCQIREERIYKGTIHGASVRVAELLKPVIVHQGAAMIVVHNHPSGATTPSNADKVLTSELSQAAATMDVDLLDHVIVARNEFSSMQRMKLLGKEVAEPSPIYNPS